MPTYSTAEYTFTFGYDADMRQVLASWRGTVPEADLYTHYAELMALAEAQGNCRFWLLDIQGRSWHRPSFRHWFANEFVALLHATLRRSVFIAYVVDASQAELVKTPVIQALEYNSAAYDVYPFFFDSGAAADEWLRHQQDHDEASRRQ